MLRILYLITLVCWSSIAIGQTKIEKVESVKEGQTIVMDFTWPELITVKTWDKNEVKLIATVSINNGQNDDAFELEVEQTSTGISISSLVKNMDDLPKKIMIKHGGQEYFFDTDDRNSVEIRAFEKENGKVKYTNFGVIMDITLEIYVPNNVILDAYCKFGLIEVIGFSGAMKINSKFGGVDVTTGNKGTLKAGTKFGEKYTDLNKPTTTISFGDHPGKWDWVSFNLNNDEVQQEVKSEFGNVYIRQL